MFFDWLLEPKASLLLNIQTQFLNPMRTIVLCHISPGNHKPTILCGNKNKNSLLPLTKETIKTCVYFKSPSLAPKMSHKKPTKCTSIKSLQFCNACCYRLCDITQTADDPICTRNLLFMRILQKSFCILNRPTRNWRRIHWTDRTHTHTIRPNLCQ